MPNRRVSTLVSSGLGSLYSMGLLLLPQAVQNFIELLGRYEVVEVVIHLDGGSPRAGAHAFHLFQRDAAIRRNLLVTDAQPLAGMLPESVAVVKQAADVRADLHVILPERLAMQHRVIRKHLDHLQRGHARWEEHTSE